MTNSNSIKDDWSYNAPVFDTNGVCTFYGKRYPYPDVWITEQRYEPTPDSTGRAVIYHYIPADDPEGWEALELGSAYYNEGMAWGDDDYDEHLTRVACFQAAELLYLHAASAGNPIGHLNLGYIYSYDRCNGIYIWHDIDLDALKNNDSAHIIDKTPIMERAVAHFRAAADAGIAEGCYKLGDMLRDGRGCEMDLDEAFQLFERAYELGKADRPVIWGSAALRLGRAYEEGEGCEQSFSEALTWYKRAETGLDIAVRAGESWYDRSLSRAKNGITRVQQELDG